MAGWRDGWMGGKMDGWPLRRTNAGAAVAVHAEAFAALAVMRAGSVDARLLASAVEDLALVHV